MLSPREISLQTIQDYSDHANKIKDIFVSKLDEIIFEKEVIDEKELRRVMHIIRRYRFFGREQCHI